MWSRKNIVNKDGCMQQVAKLRRPRWKSQCITFVTNDDSLCWHSTQQVTIANYINLDGGGQTAAAGRLITPTPPSGGKTFNYCLRLSRKDSPPPPGHLFVVEFVSFRRHLFVLIGSDSPFQLQGRDKKIIIDTTVRRIDHDALASRQLGNTCFRDLLIRVSFVR